MPGDTRDTYDDVSSTLTATSAATAGRLFGMACLKINGKAFAGLHGEAMVFKLQGDAHTRALGLLGARLFDPMERGRPMKEWVEVPRDHASQWVEFGRQALAYVDGLT